ncbi:MAG: ABC transporter substrate-binding protein [Clostridiales bacterium]|nr:ABC transporter substrate-binding protein [Clostridiales bacterium]
MNRKRIFSLACAACVALCLCACAPKTDATGSVTSGTTAKTIGESTRIETTPEATTTAETTPAETTGTVYPLKVTDSYGNTAVIESEPMRIVSCAPNVTELLFELGAGEKVVGRTDYCNYPDEVFSIDSVGSIDIPSIESIIALEPDLVIASSIFTESSYDALVGLGLPVVVWHEEYDIDGVQNMIRAVGEILDRNAEAEVLIEKMDKRIEKAVENIEGQERPSVYYAVSFGEYGDYTAGGDTFVHRLIETAGGDNIAADISGWSFSLEKLIEADPDIILVNQYMLEDFIATEPYSGLSAVQNGRVFGVDSDLLERQGYRNAEGIALLVSLFYPQE